MAKPRRINVAVVGSGVMGVAHSRAWRLLTVDYDLPVDVGLALLACRNERRTSLQRRYGWTDVTDSWTTAVERDDIDIVDICLPGDMHRHVAEAALHAGKHVLCEKPLTTSADDASALAALANHADSGTVAMVGYNYRRIPAIHHARRLVHDGHVGDLRHLRCSFLQDWAIDLASAANWRMDHTRAGFGVLGDLGSHLVDLARHVTGATFGDPHSGIMTTFFADRDGTPITTDDAFVAAVPIVDGGVATFEASRVAAGHRNHLRLEINGTDGSILFDLTEPHALRTVRRGESGWRLLSGTDLHDPWRKNWMGNPATFGTEFTYEYQALDLIESIHNATPTAPTFADAAAVHQTLESIAASAQTPA
jgi:predicted dehydrogenase